MRSKHWSQALLEACRIDSGDWLSFFLAGHLAFYFFSALPGAALHPILVWPLFLAYAASLAATEGAERALVGDFAAQEERATAFGLYHMVVGLAVLPGALLFGTVWQVIGPGAAFTMNGILSIGAVLLLQLQYRK